MPTPECFLDIRETFLYYRTAARITSCEEDRVPRICLCKVETASQHTGYGWAIASLADNPRYDTARFLAAGRARAALRRGILLDTGLAPVTVLLYARPVRRQEARVTIARCEASSFRALVDQGDWTALPWGMQPVALRKERP